MEVFNADRELREARLRDFSCVLNSIGMVRSTSALDVIDGARHRYGPEIGRLAKAAVGLSADDTELTAAWAATARAFLEVVGDSFLGLQVAPRRIGFVENDLASAVACSASWVGSGRAKPICRAELAGVHLPASNVAATIVVPREAFLAARPDLESGLVADLQRAAAARLNATFASGSAATTDAPAGIAFGATEVASTGATAAAIATDLANMIDALDNAGVSLAAASWLASPRAAATLRLLRIADDAGTLAGLPLLSAVGASGLTLVSGDHVALALDDTVQIARTEQATVELSDAPEDEVGDVVSLFQANLVALRAELSANWAVFGPSSSSGNGAVALLTGATWT
jgi:hypothetical protein